MKKTGLVLEGGAMRGMFTAGVTDVMMEHGIEFDGAVGVSAGAAFGCNYKSRQIGRSIRYNKRFCNDRRYCGLRSLLLTGNIYNTDFAYREVPLHLDEFDFAAYAANPMEFWLVCTDIETGLPVYHRYDGYHDHGFDWIRASASMPMVSRTVEIDGQKLLDGGISDDDFERAIRPVISATEKSLQTPEYWQGAIARIQTEPERLAELRDLMQDLQSMTADEIRVLAREIFGNDEKLNRFFTVPEDFDSGKQ